MVRAGQCYLKTSRWPKASYIRQLFPLQNLSYWHSLKVTAMNQMAVNESSFSPTTPCKASARATWPRPLLGRERFAAPRRTQWPYLGMRTLGNSETPAWLWMRIQRWWKNLFLVISLGIKDLTNFPVTIWTDLNDFITYNSVKILSVSLVVLMGWVFWLSSLTSAHSDRFMFLVL